MSFDGPLFSVSCLASSRTSETVIRWRLDAACMVVTGTRTL